MSIISDIKGEFLIADGVFLVFGSILVMSQSILSALIPRVCMLRHETPS